MSANQLAKKIVEQTPPVQEVKTSQTDRATQMKLFSIISVWIAFVVMYLVVSSGNETYMLAGLGFLGLTTGFLYLKN